MPEAETSQPLIETFPVGPLQCNCTILADETTPLLELAKPGYGPLLEDASDYVSLPEGFRIPSEPL